MQSVGKARTQRASHVEPFRGLSAMKQVAATEIYRQEPRSVELENSWWVDLTPVAEGSLIGPFADRVIALAFEKKWLLDRNIPEPCAEPEQDVSPEEDEEDIGIVAEQLTYYERMYAAAKRFAREAMQQTAELDAVVVVPVWRVAQPNLYSAVTVGRHGPLQTPAEVFRVASQLQAAFREYNERQWLVAEQLRQEVTALEERKATLSQEVEGM